MKLLRHILFEKIYLYFSIGNSQPMEPAVLAHFCFIFSVFKRVYPVGGAGCIMFLRCPSVCGCSASRIIIRPVSLHQLAVDF